MSGKKLSTFIFLCIFSGVISEAALPVQLSGPRPSHCCCAQAACHCKHAKGKFCPLKTSAHHAADLSALETRPAPAEFPVLKASGCGLRDEQAHPVTYSREYLLHPADLFTLHERPETYFRKDSLFPDFPYDGRHKHPPRLLLFTSI